MDSHHPVSHREIGIELFNRTWELIDQDHRTVEDDLEMIHTAHASAYHWMNAKDITPSNRSISEWQVSHVYILTGSAPQALYHGKKSLQFCLDAELTDFTLAFAYETLARAYALAAETELFHENYQLAKHAGEAIIDWDDKRHFFAELAKEPWFGMKPQNT